MTINANDTSSIPVTPAPAGPTPALTAYEQLVANLTNAIDALVAQIPEFQVPHPTTTSFVRTHLNIPMDFIAGAISAASDAPSLQASNALDVNEAREALQFIGAFQQLFDKVTLFAQNLKFTINERQATLGMKAQVLYGVAKLYARDPNNVGVTAHVKLMKAHLAKAKRPRKAKTVTPAPQPGSGTVKAPVTTPAPATGSGTATEPVTAPAPAPGSGIVTAHVTTPAWETGSGTVMEPVTNAAAPVAQHHEATQASSS
jgi:hypothetical protein